MDRHTVGGPASYSLDWRRARGVGGSTLHWEGYTLRLHADDFRLRSLYGIADDWPISYSELELYYGRAEQALGVAGAADDPWASARSTPYPLPAFPFSYSDGLFAPACRSLGIALHSLPQARNSIAYGGRPQCQACSTCHVCPTGAKASIDLTHMPDAEATGNVTILTDATVLRLETDRAGEVSAAVYARPDKVAQRVTARVFVVAAGAVETARLLLLSASRDFPEGLANRSGRVGRFFMSHPSVDVTGRARERVYPYRIGFSTAMSRQFAVEQDRRTRGSFLLQFLNSAGPTPARVAAASGLWGDRLHQHVREEFGRWLGVRIFCEQLPDRANSVSLDARVRDHFGNPVPHLRYSVGPYEREALEAATAVAGKICSSMGLTDVRSRGLTFAGHQMGTHRMGTDPATSVVDPNFEGTRRPQPIPRRGRLLRHGQRLTADADHRGLGDPRGRAHRGRDYARTAASCRTRPCRLPTGRALAGPDLRGQVSPARLPLPAFGLPERVPINHLRRTSVTGGVHAGP